MFFFVGSPHRERFSEIILDLQEKGIVSENIIEWIGEKKDRIFRYKSRIINGGKVKEHVHRRKKIQQRIHWV